jgi:hypothetical protein
MGRIRNASIKHQWKDVHAGYGCARNRPHQRQVMSQSVAACISTVGIQALLLTYSSLGRKAKFRAAQLVQKSGGVVSHT